MTTATVRCISNGYTVNWQGSQAIGVPASLYATVIPEVVYWLGRIFDPVSNPNPPADAPALMAASNPMMGAEAGVTDIASGGFIVRQYPFNLGNGVSMTLVETYAATMDDVATLLTEIFTPPTEE